MFTPVKIDGRILIDGGGVNPLPHDLLDDCDVVVAIDVMGEMDGAADKAPNLVRAVLGMFDIMQNAIIKEKRTRTPPDIYIKPQVTGVDILDFYKAEEVYKQAEPARDALRKKLAAVFKDP